MADEPTVVAPVAPVAPVTPVTEAAAPVVVETVAPVVAEAAPAPVAEAAKPVEAPVTVLAEGLDKKPAAEAPKAPVEEAPKTEEAAKPPVEEAKKTESGDQSAEPASSPVYDAFKVPDDIQLDNERVQKFTELLGEFEGKTKAEHAMVQEFGQKAVDFHIGEIKKAVESVTKLYQETWDRQKIEWKDTFLKDPEIGGNRFQTTVDSALTFIRTHGGTAEQQTEFRNLMEASGLGNHPAMIRLLANAGRAMQEGRPLAAQTPVSPPKSKTQTLYGNGKS
jgi:hypothetical protein